MTNIVELNEYQRRAIETWLHTNDTGYNIIYPTLGLCGESGEVAEKIKKLLRDHGGVLDEEMKRSIALELGDVFWYLATLSYELGFTLQEIAEMNYEKLQSRKRRNKIHGDGDNR